MTTILPKEPIAAALIEALRNLAELIETIEASDWHRSSSLPGWDVQAIVAHVVGTERLLAGDAIPPVDVDVETLDHVKNDIAKINEPWIISMADFTPEQMLTALSDATDRRELQLKEMSEDAWNKTGFTPAGPDSYGRFMRIRIFDIWMHEQDIRAVLDRPGGCDTVPVLHVLDEVGGGLGKAAAKRAKVPAGAAATISITGPLERTYNIEVDERAVLVETLSRPAATVLETDVHTFSRLLGGREPIDSIGPERLGISGDTELGLALAGALNISI